MNISYFFLIVFPIFFLGSCKKNNETNSDPTVITESTKIAAATATANTNTNSLCTSIQPFLQKLVSHCIVISTAR